MKIATLPSDSHIREDSLSEEDIYKLRMNCGLASLNYRPRLIDLFSGAGGMSLGFSKRFGHTYKSVWANDINDYACNTYNKNFGDHCRQGDLVKMLENPAIKIPMADVVIGGPPCQGFSLLNKNRQSDARKELWRPYMTVVEKSGAQVFVMENVPQLIGSVEHEAIIEYAESLGFSLAWNRLCAADYGVPQTRWRAVIIGCKFADPRTEFPPKKTHYPMEKVRRLFDDGFDEYVSKKQPWQTVRNAIADLPNPIGTEITDVASPLNLHFGRKPTSISIARYKAIPEEGMNRFDLLDKAPELTPACWVRKTTGGTDLFGRLWWERPAFTIRTEFYKPEKGRSLHPEAHRPITHREAARFQSFPDDFRFTGSKIEVAKQIGNAVPPLFASRIADSVMALLLRQT